MLIFPIREERESASFFFLPCYERNAARPRAQHENAERVCQPFFLPFSPPPLASDRGDVRLRLFERNAGFNRAPHCKKSLFSLKIESNKTPVESKIGEEK